MNEMFLQKVGVADWRTQLFHRAITDRSMELDSSMLTKSKTRELSSLM